MSTEVLSLSGHSDGQHFYHTSSLRASPIRRSSPSSSFAFDRSPSPRTAASPTEHTQEWLPAKPTSSSTVSIFAPDVITTTAISSSPPILSPTEPPVEQNPVIEIDLPSYHDASFGSQRDAVSTPPSSPTLDDDYSDEPTDPSATSDTTRSSLTSPLLTPTVCDDTAAKQLPSRQVDFLSHDWREEDIWSSWRHIVSQRKSIYGEKSRLENASWRTWAKSKYRLPTVSPEKLNWLKESDVTWLYGPLKLASSYPITQRDSKPKYKLSQSNSFIHKKPILKKRSASEVMLQQSLSSSSLLKQAAASIQAQGRTSRKTSSDGDAVDSKFGSETASRVDFDYFTSTSNSISSTPFDSQERRHIRFDDRVEQCIAVDCKDVGMDFGDDSDGENDLDDYATDSSSDEGIMINSTHHRTVRSRRSSSNGSRRNSLSGKKTIETLPATTLKYRTDSPDIPEDSQQHSFTRLWSAGKLSPSASQVTLRPTNPNNNFLLPDENDDNRTDADSSSWSFGAANPKSSLGASGRWSRSEDDEDLPGMRRTGSGMFMPYDDDEDDLVAQGLFGRVSETINTARDIAHVIWNVGWRK